MTTISILGGDFEILFDDETVGTNAVAGMRMVRRASGATTTVYTSLALYSAVADEADAFQAMGFTNPMLPTTPNAFSMENFYFMPRSSTEFLKEGTFTCDWTSSALPDTNGNGVVRVVYAAGTNFVAGDIGRQVIQTTGGDSGTLLDFEIDPDGLLYAWIRPDVSGTDIFAGSGSLTVVADGGTGASTTSGTGSTGITKYTAIQAIGSVATASEVYIIQNRIKLADSATAAFQWWATDPTQSLGIISVLVRTRTSGVDVADEDLEVFARRYTSLFDQFRLNVSAGGFSALPLASAPDINNTTGYFAGVWNTGTGTAMLVGDVLDNTTGGKTGGSYVVTAVADSGATGTFEYYHVGDLTAFATLDTFTSANRNGAINGAPTANVGGPTETGAGNGGTVTITLGLNTTADHDGSGVNEAYSVTIDAQGPGANGVAVADVYERIKYVCRRGSDNTFWNTVATTVDGEQYRGMEAQVFTDTPTGVFTEGDDITGQGGYTARVFGSNIAATGEGTLQNYVMLTDQQTSLDAIINNDTLTDTTGGDTVLVDTAGAGGVVQQFTSPKASPFGTFTGSQLFGARGVLYTGQNDNDTQAYTLIDDNAVQRVSPNTVTFSVANTLALDRVLVARDTGVSGIIDKDQFGGMTAVAASSPTITVAGTVDAEVPTAGYLRVVETTKQEEHKYEYSSRTTGASGVFTLTAITPSTATAGTGVTTLIDSTADFVTEGVVPGMLIQNTTGGFTFEVVSRTNLTTLVIVQVFGTGGTFASTNAYTINETIQLYAVTDNIYDLILDTEATGTTTSNTFVQSTLFDTVVNVRQGKAILPFTQNQAVTASGASVTVVRQADTIAV